MRANQKPGVVAVVAMAMTCAFALGCGFSVNTTTSDGPIDDLPPDIPIDESVSTPRVTTGLIGLWRFDEGSGAVVRDRAIPPSGMTPMDLTITPTTAISWVAGGLDVVAKASIASSDNPHAGRQINDADAMTIEVWLTPNDVTQGTGPADAGGPDFATVVTLSGSIVSRAATIAQVGDHWIGRIRTTIDGNGNPEIVTPAGTASTAVTHLVLVASPTSRGLFVNGVVSMSSPSGVGSLDWDIHYPFRLSDEAVYDRRWSGKIWLMAVYNRALNAAEVEQNRMAGHNCADC